MAHYCEELATRRGFRSGDLRYAAGVALDALRGVTRFACAIGVHTDVMSVADAAGQVHRECVPEDGPAALAEARRALFDPTYGRYTWGKLVIRDLRARDQWGPVFRCPVSTARYSTWERRLSACSIPPFLAHPRGDRAYRTPPRLILGLGALFGHSTPDRPARRPRSPL